MKRKNMYLILAISSILIFASFISAGLISNNTELFGYQSSMNSDLENEDNYDRKTTYVAPPKAANISISSLTIPFDGTGWSYVNISDGEYVSLVSVNISWDTSIVNVSSVEYNNNDWGDFLGPGMDPLLNTNEGYLIFDAFNFTGGVTGDIWVARLLFEPAQGVTNGCSPANFTDWSLVNATYLTIPTTAHNGTICIIGEDCDKSIYGIKFNDSNGNGIKDISEPGLSGWTINLKADDLIKETVITNETGHYEFDDLCNGDYIVEEVMQSGWQNTTPYTQIVTIECSSIEVNFGNAKISTNPDLSVEKTIKETCCSDHTEFLAVEPGDDFYYNITVENTGDVTLNISINDTIPEDLSIMGDAGETYHSGALYVWNFSNVLPGEIVTLEFQVIASLDACGIIENEVTVNGFNAEEIVVTKTDTANINVVCGNLTVLKSVKQNCNMPWSEVGIELDPDVCDWVTFMINITNMESHPLDINVKDMLPDAFTYDNHATPKEPDHINNDTNTYYWNFTDVASGDMISIMYRAVIKEHMCDVYTNHVNVTGTYSDICEDITLYGEDSVYVDILCDEGISVKKFASLDGVNWMNDSIDTLIDDVVYFKINVTNTGDIPLEGVRVNDTIPDMVSYNYDADPNLSKPFEDQKLEWFFVSIPAGESRILTYSVTVNEHGVADNIVNATACGGSPTDEDTVTIESEGGMNVRKTVSLDGEHWYENVTAPIGETVRFNITLSYFNEEYYLFHVHIKDILPDGLTYANNAVPKEPVIVNNTLYWNFTGDTEYLINGSKIFIEFDATVTDEGEKINVVNVTAQECSGLTLYDEDTAIVYTPPGPDMNASKLVQADNGSWVTEVDANIGEILTFNITITNPGSAPLYGIDITDVLPENLSYVSGSSEIHYLDDVLEVEPEIDEENNTLLWNNLNFYTGEYLSPGQSISLYYDVEVTGYGLLKNDATIKACKCSHCELQLIKVFAIINVSTIDNDAPVISNPYPADDATDVDTRDFELEVKVTDGDDDEMDVTFYDDSDDSVIGTENDVSSGETVSMPWDDLEYNTTYNWYVKVTDGKTTVTSPTWTFTTELEGSNHEPNAPTNPSPSNGASNVVRNPTISVYVSDPDDDALTIKFYDASDNSLIGTDTCPSDCTASVTWTGLDYQTTYRWYAIVDDGEYDVLSSTWSFTTETLDIDLNLNIEGGFGITLEIENAGSDAAYDVSWSIHVANEGFLNRIDKTESGSVAMISAGSVVYQDMRVFAIGRVEITATASCDGATPVTKVQDAMIIGSFVILR